jgi:Rrf2 family protein
MKMSRTSTYALQAILQLARSEAAGVPVPCSRLAAEGKMPERFLLQILRNLVSKGILTSTRGVDGGYALERKPEDISLLEVIEAVDGPVAHAVRSLEGLSGDHRKRLECALRDVTELARGELQSIKLVHLLVGS